MIMQCRKCSRKMGLWELTTYPAAYFLKLVVPALVPVVIAAIAQALKQGTRGFIDESMAGFANNFLIACPKCKETDCWDPVSAEQDIEVNEVRDKEENKAALD